MLDCFDVANEIISVSRKIGANVRAIEIPD
jgi:hypothetical protein